MLSPVVIIVLSAGATTVANDAVTESRPMRKAVIRGLIGLLCVYYICNIELNRRKLSDILEQR